ncbi:MAG: FAD-dependent monooxygenase [Steroidobacteraceae bacterium]|jgi:salicylate hydroxylase
MDREAHIAIVGAGICGLTAALALARLGFRRIAVYERSPALGEVGAGLTLSPNATRALIGLGLGETLERAADEPHTGLTRHWRDARVLTRSERGAAIRAKYGAPYLQIHRADLLEMLAQASAREAAIEVHTAHALVGIDTQGERSVLQFENGARVSADVVLGCDGLKSAVRNALFGETPAQFSGYVAWRALVPASALAVPLDPPAQLFIGIERMFMRYLVRHGALVNVVAVARSPGWTDEGWMIPSTVAELRAQYDGWYRDIQDAIDHVPPEQCFKWAIHVRSALPHWHAGNVVLAGDAAHPMVPFMGMGAAMGIEDGVVLARALAARNTPQDAYAAYTAARHERASFVQTESARRGLRLMSHDPDSFGRVQEVSEDTLGLFAYDVFGVAV